VIRTRSESGYLETVASLIAAIERRGLTLFARIDHAAGARDVGLELADEQVLVFGNARTGTPLMESDPQVGLDLPLRILVSRERDGVWIGYHDPRELSASYDIRRHQPILEQMAGLLSGLAGDAARRPGQAGAGAPQNPAR
jgi:uncharacterized protein (DUF302 family)